MMRMRMRMRISECIGLDDWSRGIVLASVGMGQRSFNKIPYIYLDGGFQHREIMIEFDNWCFYPFKC
jgi:hypothetical protein